MAEIIIIGGGWAGCSAALTARKTGAKVRLLERTDMLLGLGNVGGIMRNNGRFTAAEENIAMGAGELFELTDELATHSSVDFPGHRHASFYSVLKVEPRVRRLLEEKGIEIRTQCRITDVEKDGTRITGVTSADGEYFGGDVFVDCTGTTGPMGNCMEFLWIIDQRGQALLIQRKNWILYCRRKMSSLLRTGIRLPCIVWYRLRRGYLPNIPDPRCVRRCRKTFPILLKN